VDVRKAERDMGFGWTTLAKSFGDMAEQFYKLNEKDFLSELTNKRRESTSLAKESKEHTLPLEKSYREHCFWSAVERDNEILVAALLF